MTEQCRWLHYQLQTLPFIRYPFRLDQLPLDGIYFFYEDGETTDHGDGPQPRIVRIGTHKDGNFRSRMSEHYLFTAEAKKMAFSLDQAAPHERSIFRKNLGRALLNRAHDPYLAVWELDFTKVASKAKNKHLRDLAKEKAIETEVTRLLRQTFAFRFILLEGQAGRMGSTGLESNLIGTVAQCQQCQASPTWLGRHSPKPEVTSSALWLAQHLKSPIITPAQQQIIQTAIVQTQQWIASHP